MLYAGRLHPTKGVEVAIKVLAILNSQDDRKYTLDIAGTGQQEYVEKLKTIGSDLHLNGHLRFLGHLSRDSLMKHYQSYSILLFPSVYPEAFGLTVIEAMAKGVPVIASKRGGPLDIITHMEDGLLVEPENPKAFAEGVNLLESRPELRKKIAENAIKKIKRKFTLETHVEKTEKVLFKIAKY